jgi:hypothetical protein
MLNSVLDEVCGQQSRIRFSVPFRQCRGKIKLVEAASLAGRQSEQSGQIVSEGLSYWPDRADFATDFFRNQPRLFPG